MEIKRKNLCAMIPEEVHTRVREEQEQMGLKLNEYVEMIIKEHLKLTGQSQKEFVIGLIEQALAQKADQAEPGGNEQPDEAGTENE